MSDDKTSPSDKRSDKAAARDTFHAKRRRARRDQTQARREKATRKTGGGTRPTIEGDFSQGPAIYGLHTVRAALANPRRKVRGLLVTKNALDRLTAELETPLSTEPEIVQPSRLDRLVGSDAVHQGVVLLVEPIDPLPLAQLAKHRSIMVLDQVTDPHNVGAIMRSAVALGVGALLTTSRHAAAQTGVLAKAASGALDMIDLVEVTNLGDALEKLHKAGFTTLGLDSEGEADLANTLPLLPKDAAIAIVLGAEGKGLRQKTRETVHHLARLDMPGTIKSLNVSNAAVLAAYALHQHRGSK
ncbi:MAG: RNA methyltransferase [Pseudomonadota bacterium]